MTDRSDASLGFCASCGAPRIIAGQSHCASCGQKLLQPSEIARGPAAAAAVAATPTAPAFPAFPAIPAAPPAPLPEQPVAQPEAPPPAFLPVPPPPAWAAQPAAPASAPAAAPAPPPPPPIPATIGPTPEASGPALQSAAPSPSPALDRPPGTKLLWGESAMEGAGSSGPATTPGVLAGPPEEPRPAAARLARIPRRAVIAAVAVVILVAGGLVAWQLLGSSGYVIKADAFTTNRNQCTLVVNLSGGGAGVLNVNVESGSVSIGHSSGFLPFCIGAKHTWLGTVTYSGYTFTSDATTPLHFEVTADGYKYVSGKGTVAQPDGKIVTLGG